MPAAGATSTQESFGRILTRLGDVEGVAERIVTTSPDVSVSTNLGGWINKVGVFTPAEATDYLGEDRLLRWRQSPSGRHIELGISEMNLFLLLQALGFGHDLHGEHLLPIGTVYDPFVCRGLDALIYALYSGSRFVVVGTPAGITLAPEGGAHQSTITPSIGLELPGLTYAEPAYARALDWLLCDGLAELGRAGRRLAVPAPVDPPDRPAPVRHRARPRRRRAAARRRPRRRLPPPRTRRASGRRAGDVRTGGSRGAGRGDGARRGGRARPRARPHQLRPLVPRLARHAALGRTRGPPAGRRPPPRVAAAAG